MPNINNSLEAYSPNHRRVIAQILKYEGKNIHVSGDLIGSTSSHFQDKQENSIPLVNLITQTLAIPAIGKEELISMYFTNKVHQEGIINLIAVSKTTQSDANLVLNIFKTIPRGEKRNV